MLIDNKYFLDEFWNVHTVFLTCLCASEKTVEEEASHLHVVQVLCCFLTCCCSAVRAAHLLPSFIYTYEVWAVFCI